MLHAFRELSCVRRLYAMGIITTKKSLVQLQKLATSAFCRRRLSVVMVRLKMAETLKEACTLIEQVGQRSLSGLRPQALAKASR